MHTNFSQKILRGMGSALSKVSGGKGEHSQHPYPGEAGYGKKSEGGMGSPAFEAEVEAAEAARAAHPAGALERASMKLRDGTDRAIQRFDASKLSTPEGVESAEKKFRGWETKVVAAVEEAEKVVPKGLKERRHVDAAVDRLGDASTSVLDAQAKAANGDVKGAEKKFVEALDHLNMAVHFVNVAAGAAYDRSRGKKR